MTITNQTSGQLLERLPECWSVMQRAQELSQSAAKTSAAKMTGGSFSNIDFNSVMAAYAKVGIALANPKRSPAVSPPSHPTTQALSTVQQSQQTVRSSLAKECFMTNQTTNIDPLEYLECQQTVEDMIAAMAPEKQI